MAHYFALAQWLRTTDRDLCQDLGLNLGLDQGHVKTKKDSPGLLFYRAYCLKRVSSFPTIKKNSISTSARNSTTITKINFDKIENFIQI